MIYHPLQYRWDEDRLRAVQWYVASASSQTPRPSPSTRPRRYGLTLLRWRRERVECPDCPALAA